MELKFVVPNMAQTFGNLEFAGEKEVEQRRINGRMSVLSRSFNLYSDVQRADDIIVVLPAEAGEKHFQPEPYTLERTMSWIARQVAPTLKILKRIDAGNGTDYLRNIEEQAKLSEKHKKIIKQQTTSTEEIVLK